MQFFMMNHSLAFAVVAIFFCIWVCSAMPVNDDELENVGGKLIKNKRFWAYMK